MSQISPNSSSSCQSLANQVLEPTGLLIIGNIIENNSTNRTTQPESIQLSLVVPTYCESENIQDMI
ncbi:MAG: glycosyltransferase family 2 protein, partial [Cyanobacteriota bacterium]|nr:glycosyltransferase family 2 protein [Cyanobacteriota bacterium]